VTEWHSVAVARARISEAVLISSAPRHRIDEVEGRLGPSVMGTEKSG
jgi:hypothetical protein